jgi:hypothetical protein
MDVRPTGIDGVQSPPAVATGLTDLILDGRPLRLRQEDRFGWRSRFGRDFLLQIRWLDTTAAATHPPVLAARKAGLVGMPGQMIGEGRGHGWVSVIGESSVAYAPGWSALLHIRLIGLP